MNNAQAKRMAFTENNEGITVKGKWFWKKRWLSICSAPEGHDKDCSRCKTGSWNNVWLLAISGWFHDNVYWLWVWWVNNI
jgi:hypothetical protein